MSSFLDSTGLSELASQLKSYFMKKPASASTGIYPIVGYDSANSVGKYNSNITLDMANRIMGVFASGLTRTVIGSSAVDLNNYVPGTYGKLTVYEWSYSNKGNVSNKPADAAGEIAVFGYNSTCCVQFAMLSGITNMYMRSYNGSKWTTWEPLRMSYKLDRVSAVANQIASTYYTDTACYAKVASVTLTAQWDNASGTWVLNFHGEKQNNALYLLQLNLRADSNGSVGVLNGCLRLLHQDNNVVSGGNVKVYYVMTGTSGNNLTVDLWVRMYANYEGFGMTELSSGSRGGSSISPWTYYNVSNANATLPSGAVEIVPRVVATANLTTNIVNSYSIGIETQSVPNNTTDFNLMVPATYRVVSYSINGSSFTNGPSGNTGHWGILNVYWRYGVPYQEYISETLIAVRYSNTYNNGQWTNWSTWKKVTLS